jgi:hypothetical protein
MQVHYALISVPADAMVNRFDDPFSINPADPLKQNGGRPPEAKRSF